MKLDQSPEIVRIANTLGIYGNPRPVEAIVAYCFARVTGWMQELGIKVESLRELERLICAKLRLKIEYVESEEDIDRIAEFYATKGEVVFRTLRSELDSQTFGALIQRLKATNRDRDLYVAVIDCRGLEKRARRNFSKWHEVAHALTLKGQLEFVLHRSRDDKRPEEQLMDIIAGRIGFFPSIFERGFEAELNAYGRFSFGLVQRVLDNVCPGASFESTLIACVRTTKQPCVLVKVGLGLKKSERARVLSKQVTFLDEDPPIETLRAISAVGNAAAKEAGLLVHENIRIPDESHLYQAFYQGEGNELLNDKPWRENLGNWRHSDGRSLKSINVDLVMRRHGSMVYALVLLPEAHDNRPL